MTPVLNRCRIHTAVVGNHDFDFGLDQLNHLISESNFKWLLSNVTSRSDGQRLVNRCDTLRLVEYEGVKVGIIGLAEEEWAATLNDIKAEDIIVKDFLEVGNALSLQLREAGAEIVIALTHMRLPNDIMLAEKCPHIDLILGGHDHDVVNVASSHGRNRVVKSGCDFRAFSHITLHIDSPQHGNCIACI